MLIATKKNRQLRIPDEKASTYITLGYTIKDTTGKVVSEPVSKAKQVETLTAQNEALKEEVAALKAKLAEKEAATDAATAAETEEAATETATAKKKTAAKKTATE